MKNIQLPKVATVEQTTITASCLFRPQDTLDPTVNTWNTPLRKLKLNSQSERWSLIITFSLLLAKSPLDRNLNETKKYLESVKYIKSCFIQFVVAHVQKRFVTANTIKVNTFTVTSQQDAGETLSLLDSNKGFISSLSFLYVTCAGLSSSQDLRNDTWLSWPLQSVFTFPSSLASWNGLIDENHSNRLRSCLTFFHC